MTSGFKFERQLQTRTNAVTLIIVIKNQINLVTNRIRTFSSKSLQKMV